MIALLYIAAAALAAAAIHFGRIAFVPLECSSESSDLLGFFGMMIFGFAALGFFIVPTVILPSRAIGATSCHNWSEQTGYPSKFRVLNWFDTGKCLARTPDGHWTLNTNIIVNVPAKP